MKTKFAFWNLNKKPLQELLRLLVDTFDIDILILAESNIPDDLLLITLNNNSERQFTFSSIISSQSLKFLIRYPQNLLTPRLDTNRMSIQEFTPPLGLSVLIVAVHLPSKMFMNDDEQDMLCTELIRQIESIEAQENHRRTIVVGDFNMDPFSKGMTGALGMHAIMDKKVAQGVSRTVMQAERHYFYNPMWSVLGDFSAGPPGSYYYRGGIISYFWHMFDQVLIRPGLIEKFDNADLVILTSIGDVTLKSSSGFPNSTIASDHFPLLFALDLA